MASERRVCFVTGSRAEFGLMRTALQAIRAHPRLILQLIVTGMHLDPRHGPGLLAIEREGWPIDAVVDWPADGQATPATTAAHTGRAMASLAAAFDKLGTDVVLVVGDRVEVFAAAAAGCIAQRLVAHVHGGDRAAGQVDDSLRHAITKLAHLHFPATAASARRLARLGEDRWRIHVVGSPGIDGMGESAAPWPLVQQEFPGLLPRRFALLVLHPAGSDGAVERARARSVSSAVAACGCEQIVVVYPNNDPGAWGIIEHWDSLLCDPRFHLRRDLPRPLYLGLLREAALLAGNSSSGIIEAASFGVPVVDIGPRQAGRECSANTVHAPYARHAILRALRHIWNGGQPRRSRCRNVYGGQRAGQRIAQVLARLPQGRRLARKLIAF